MNFLGNGRNIDILFLKKIVSYLQPNTDQDDPVRGMVVGNVPFEGCGCDCGSPLEISGVIRNGRRYDDGNVSVETYNQGMQAMQIRINNVGEVAAQANSKAAEAEKSTGKLATVVDAIAEKHTRDIEVLNTDVNALSDANTKLGKQISDTAT